MSSKHILIYVPTVTFEGYPPANVVILNINAFLQFLLQSSDASDQYNCCDLNLQAIPDPHILPTINSMVAGERLFLFGGVDPPNSELFPNFNSKSLIKTTYSYNLSNPHLYLTGTFDICGNLIHGISKSSLVVQTNDESFHVLSLQKVDHDQLLKLVLHEYNLVNDFWSNPYSEIIDTNELEQMNVRTYFNTVPHLVIGRKLHVSIGNKSFTFDTEEGNDLKRESCSLFDKFWAKGKKLDEDGCDLFGRFGSSKSGKRKVDSSGGQPFAFTGKGVIFDSDILLGVQWTISSPLAAFRLNKNEMVVDREVIWTDSDMGPYDLLAPPRLLDLGRGDGHFVLVRVFPSADPDGLRSYGELDVKIELVLLKVSRPHQETKDHFLDCQLVGKAVIADKLPRGVEHSYGAFCF